MKFTVLIDSLRELDSSLKQQVKSTANVGLTLRNWLVGACIIEFEQHGEDRAHYGEGLLDSIATKLEIKGLNTRNLEICRLLYREYPEISQTLSAKSGLVPSSLLTALKRLDAAEKSKTVSAELEKCRTLPGQSPRPDFAPPPDRLVTALSFSHFVELMRIEAPEQRAFYELECIKNGWSVRELKRQIGSLYYERLGLSNDKEKLLRLVRADASEHTQSLSRRKSTRTMIDLYPQFSSPSRRKHRNRLDESAQPIHRARRQSLRTSNFTLQTSSEAPKVILERLAKLEDEIHRGRKELEGVLG